VQSCIGWLPTVLHSYCHAAVKPPTLDRACALRAYVSASWRDRLLLLDSTLPHAASATLLVCWPMPGLLMPGLLMLQGGNSDIATKPVGFNGSAAGLQSNVDFPVKLQDKVPSRLDSSQPGTSSLCTFRPQILSKLQNRNVHFRPAACLPNTLAGCGCSLVAVPDLGCAPDDHLNVLPSSACTVGLWMRCTLCSCSGQGQQRDAEACQRQQVGRHAEGGR
jgi:hypothetical protein